MAVPLIEKVINKVVVLIKESYPIIYEKQGPEKLEAQLKLLSNDEIIVSFKHTESIINYLVICVKYGIDYQYLIQRERFASVLRNTELHESEKLYLIDEKLHYS